MQRSNQRVLIAMYIIHDPSENLCKIIRRFSPFWYEDKKEKKGRRKNGTKRESFREIGRILYIDLI